MPSALPQCSHITRKRGIYYYRRRLPVPSQGEVALSLRTRRFREAEHLACLLDAMWRAALSKTPIDHPKIQMILREALQDRLDADLRRRAGRSQGAVYTADWDEEAWPDPVESDLALIREQMESDRYDIRAGRSPGRIEYAEELIKQHGLPPDLVNILAVGLAEASLKAWEVIERRTLGQEQLLFAPKLPESVAIGGPSAPLAGSGKGDGDNTVHAEGDKGADVPVAEQAPKVSDLIDAYIKDRALRDKTTQQVMNQERGTLRRFIEACGDREPAGY